jgi:hypothetical protein
MVLSVYVVWYANIPEEVTYLNKNRKIPFTVFGAVVMNFVFPILLLINTKRTSIVVGAGVVILRTLY